MISVTVEVQTTEIADLGAQAYATCLILPVEIPSAPMRLLLVAA